MSVTADQLASARKLRRSAAVELLAGYYPLVYRMARGLCGEESAALSVLRFVFPRSLRRLPKWREESEPDRWFHHHALLASRRAASKWPETMDVRQDLLVVSAGTTDPAFLAFIRALRTLPFQQREAFILSNGERFNARHVAVAMDCSVHAVETHLLAANKTLRAIAGDQWELLLDLFVRAYSNLTPPDDGAQAFAGRYFGRHMKLHVWPKRIIILIRLALLIATIAAAAYVTLKWRAQIEQYLPK